MSKVVCRWHPWRLERARRESGTERSTRAQRLRTGSLTLQKLLRQPKVTKPRHSAGNVVMGTSIPDGSKHQKVSRRKTDSEVLQGGGVNSGVVSKNRSLMR